MANFDEDIKRITAEVLEDGTVDKIIREKVVEGFENAIDNAFRWGDLKKSIETRVKDIMVPFIEEYDMSEYLLKLETCLGEVIKNSAAIDQKKMLENFENIMVDRPKQDWTLKELLDEYRKFVAKDIDTDGMGIDYDDGVSYDYFEVSVELEEDDDKWYDWKPCFFCDMCKNFDAKSPENMERTECSEYQIDNYHAAQNRKKLKIVRRG